MVTQELIRRMVGVLGMLSGLGLLWGARAYMPFSRPRLMQLAFGLGMAVLGFQVATRYWEAWWSWPLLLLALAALFLRPLWSRNPARSGQRRPPPPPPPPPHR